LADADFAILNGTHATTVAALLAGKPTLHFPQVLEQWILAHRVAELGAGTAVHANRAHLLAVSIRGLANGEYQAGAAAFAQKYGQFDSQMALQRAVDTIEHAVLDAVSR
jgi:UDP:flavonoid glycosyltransferase YjiC (YdhE family)